MKIFVNYQYYLNKTINNNYIEKLKQLEKKNNELFIQTLNHIKFKQNNVKLSVVYTDNEYIKKLNNYYRKKNYPTDVLSFPTYEYINENNLYNNNNNKIYLGDIIISIPKIIEQHIEYSHSFERETCFLNLHGFLHLLGYTHDTIKNKKKMFDIQKFIIYKNKLK